MIAPASEDELVGWVEDRDICLRELDAETCVKNGAEADQGMLEGGHDLDRSG